MWGCEKFTDYVLGKQIQLETDHKPLVPLLSTTHLDCMPPRVLRFRLRLTRFDYTITHVRKFLYAADALSRAPGTYKQPAQEYPDTEFIIQALIAYLPADADRLESYRRAQQADPTSQILQYCSSEWPNKHTVPGELIPYGR